MFVRFFLCKVFGGFCSGGDIFIFMSFGNFKEDWNIKYCEC